jgi:hypothetical protein
MLKSLVKRALMGAAGLAFLMGTAVAAPAEEKAQGDPYPLETCPVSGKKLDEKAVAKVIDGREVKFCCGGCPDKFTADKAASFAKLDEAIIQAQKADYPVATCPVSGKEVAADAGVDKVEGNRLVRFCCGGCPAKYEADPATYSAKLDEAIVTAQKEKYPLDTCVVSGEKLGEMGEPADLVIQNQLVRLCCAGCEKKLRQDPAKYLSKIDEASKAKAKG